MIPMSYRKWFGTIQETYASPIKKGIIATIVGGLVVCWVLDIPFDTPETLGEQTRLVPSTFPSITTHNEEEKATVIRVIDGDTIRVDIGKEQKGMTIRLIGVDTPESVHPNKPVECFGKEASDYLKKLVAGKNVRLVRDPSQGDLDKYGRMLRYAYLEDGTFVNEQIIAEGYGHEYTYDEPYQYQERFRQAQEQAQRDKKGLWADDACVTNTLQPSIPPNTLTVMDSPPPTLVPTTVVVPPNHQPFQQQVVPAVQNNTNNFNCDCSKTCGSMTSCEEAMYQLNVCGCGARDGDNDGVPCESGQC